MSQHIFCISNEIKELNVLFRLQIWYVPRPPEIYDFTLCHGRVFITCENSDTMRSLIQFVSEVTILPKIWSVDRLWLPYTSTNFLWYWTSSLSCSSLHNLEILVNLPSTPLNSQVIEIIPNSTCYCYYSKDVSNASRFSVLKSLRGFLSFLIWLTQRY